MSAPIFLTTIGLPLLTVLIIFAMRYASVVMAARARLANDEAYRQLAEQAAASQSATAAALASIDASLAELKARMSGVERVLKEVE